MKFSFNIYLLGWWLTRQWQLSKGQNDYKPSISVRPSNVVPLGEAFSISCTSKVNTEVQFFLYRSQSLSPVRRSQMAYHETLFNFTDAKLIHGEIYYCTYCFSINRRYTCSYHSDKVKITIKGQLYPKPSISVSPRNMIAAGENVDIHCKTEKFIQAEFYLLKEDSFLHFILKTAGKEATFPFIAVNKLDGGLYRCNYCNKSTFYELCSDYSDQVPISIRDPSLPKPSIQVKPRESITPGQNITIECQGPKSDLNFSLHNAGDLLASQITVPDKNSTEFPFFMVDFKNTGNYTCQYHLMGYPFVWSEPSDPVELLVKEDTFPEFTTLIWVGTTSGLVLLLVLLLLIFFLYRKRKKGSIAEERNELVDPPQNVYAEIAPYEITYAELNLDSLKTKQETKPEEVTKQGVHASIALHKSHWH
ncbi:immunoglobulin superfamily member 1-like isoform 1-T1 [Liasis olivaceus]